MNIQSLGTIYPERKAMRTSSTKWLSRLFAMLLVVTMQTVYVKLHSSFIPYLLNGLLIAVGLLLLLENRTVRFPRALVEQLACWWLLFVVILVCHVTFLQGVGINYRALSLITIMCTALFAISACCAYIVGVKAFLEDIANAIYIIICASLIFYFIGQVLHVMGPTSQVTIDWGGTRHIDSYFYLLFTPQGGAGYNYHSFANGRFTGIFVEAPMCAFMVCVALIVYLFISDKKPKPIRLAILLIALYATVSATGYVVVCLMMSLYFLLQVDLSRKQRLARMALSIVIIPLALICINSVLDMKYASDVGSTTIRDTNFASALADFASSPLFGLGFKSDTTGVTGGNTSVYSNVLQQGGGALCRLVLLAHAAGAVRLCQGTQLAPWSHYNSVSNAAVLYRCDVCVFINCRRGSLAGDHVKMLKERRELRICQVLVGGIS